MMIQIVWATITMYNTCLVKSQYIHPINLTQILKMGIFERSHHFQTIILGMLVFGSVNHFKQFQFRIFLHPSPISNLLISSPPKLFLFGIVHQESALAFNNSRSASKDGSLADAAFTAQCKGVCWCGSNTLGIARSSKSCCNTARWRHPAATCLRNF